MLPGLNSQHKLTLASSSPRRAEILRAVGWPFAAITANVDESLLPGESPLSYVRRLAQAKAQAVMAKVETGTLILGADTTVVVNGEILGQPHDDADARRMLRLLSGKRHEVLTGIALTRAGHEDAFIVDHEVTGVRFAHLSEEQIDWYVSTAEPMGKAGGYAIQGAAALFIEEVQGDYFNVVGLPVRLVYELASRI